MTTSFSSPFLPLFWGGGGEKHFCDLSQSEQSRTIWWGDQGLLLSGTCKACTAEPLLCHAFNDTGTGTLQSNPSYRKINSQVSLCGCSQPWRRECFKGKSQSSLTLSTTVARRYFGSHQRQFVLLFGRTDSSRCFEPKCLNSSLLPLWLQENQDFAAVSKAGRFGWYSSKESLLFFLCSQ